MAEYILENDELRVKISSAGAELRSVVDKRSGVEKMWQADPAFWGRTSPVLFPLVGQYRDGVSRFDGKEYHMGQHGFARDREFTLLETDGTLCRFILRADAATKEKYPFDFELVIGYRLTGRTLTVSWEVKNTDARKMYFSIGAHPAFNCGMEGYRLRFDTKEPLTVGVLRGGVYTDEKKHLPLDESGAMAITPALFDDDALIIENDQAHSCAIIDPQGECVVQVTFDAPLFGIWSPVGKCAPFVCIEPWYGRSDRFDFDQQLEKREWGNSLEAGETFHAGYQMNF